MLDSIDSINCLQNAITPCRQRVACAEADDGLPQHACLVTAHRVHNSTAAALDQRCGRTLQPLQELTCLTCCVWHGSTELMMLKAQPLLDWNGGELVVACLNCAASALASLVMDVLRRLIRCR